MLLKIKKTIILIISTFPFLPSCLSSPNDKIMTIDDGQYHARVAYNFPAKKIDTTFYGYVKIQKGFVTELDSENGKPYKLGVYNKAKIDDYTSYAEIKTWNGAVYGIEILNDWGELWGIHQGRRQEVPPVRY